MDLKKIKKLVAEDIEVLWSENEVEFRRGRHRVSFEPAIYLSDESDGVPSRRTTEGGPPTPKRVVRPFSPERFDHPTLSRQEAVETFLHRGFSAVTRRIYLTLPDVYFHGAEKLERSVQEIDRSMLSAAAKAAGARKCYFS
jgi:hypothetical protein